MAHSIKNMDLQERITNKKSQIAKMERNLVKYVVDDEFTAMCDRYFETRDMSELKQYKIQHNMFCLPEYYSKRYALEDAKATLAKYEKQLKAEEDKNATLQSLPESVVEFRDELIKNWDRYDIWKRDEISKEYDTLSDIKNYDERKEARNKIIARWGRNYYEFMYLKDDKIHEQNVKDANTLIINMIDRVVSIVGQITDTKYLTLDRDNSGYSIINGRIIGTEGTATINSILAGGYNIQRLHVRVLVK